MDYQLSRDRVKRVALHVTCLPPQVNGISSRYHALLSEISRKDIEIVAIFTSYPNPIEYNSNQAHSPDASNSRCILKSPHTPHKTTFDDVSENSESAAAESAESAESAADAAQKRKEKEKDLQDYLLKLYKYAGPGCEWVQLHYTYEQTSPGVRLILHCYHNFEMIYNALRRTKPDLLHSTVDACTGNALVAAHLCNIPCCSAVHTDVAQIITKNKHLNSFDKWWRLRTLRYFEWMVLHFSNNIGTVSTSFAKLLENQHNINCDFVIRSNVNLRVFESKYAIAAAAAGDAVERDELNKNAKSAENEEMSLEVSASGLTHAVTKNAGIRRMRHNLMFGHGSDEDAVLISYAGRFSYEKNIGYLMKCVRNYNKMNEALALEDASQRRSKVYLAVIGDGPIADELAAQHSEQHGIHCVPGFMTHEELSLVYSASDASISASKFETFGNTVIESFACATPVLVAFAQGFQDSTRHEENGYFFCYCDGCDELEQFERCQECGMLNLRDSMVKYLVGPGCKNELQRIGKKACMETRRDYSVVAAAQHMVEWWDRALVEYKGTKECFPEKQLVFAIQLVLEFLFVLQCWFTHLFQFSHKCQHD